MYVYLMYIYVLNSMLVLPISAKVIRGIRCKRELIEGVNVTAFHEVSGNPNTNLIKIQFPVFDILAIQSQRNFAHS